MRERNTDGKDKMGSKGKVKTGGRNATESLLGADRDKFVLCHGGVLEQDPSCDSPRKACRADTGT